MGHQWSQEEKDQFYRDHPWLAPAAVVATGIQVKYPAIADTLAPIDSVVTGTRDTIIGGIDLVKWLAENRYYILGGMGVYMVLSLRR